MRRAAAMLTLLVVTACQSVVAPSNPANADFAKGGKATNYALAFTSSYVNVPDHDLLDLTSTWTLEAWVTPADATTGIDQDIISKWAGVTTASYILQIDATGKLRLVTNNGITQTIVLSGRTLRDNVWQHVAATFDHGTVKLYLDGALDTTVTGALTPIASTEPLAFGREGNYTGGTMNGRLDEIRIWNVVRSGAKIAHSRTTRLRGTEAGLVGYWHFDEGSGQVASDATGHGLDGRLGETTGVDAWDPAWISDAAPVH